MTQATTEPEIDKAEADAFGQPAVLEHLLDELRAGGLT